MTRAPRRAAAIRARADRGRPAAAWAAFPVSRSSPLLAPEAWPAWLGEEPADEAHLKSLLVPYPSDDTICWPVNPRVGNVKNNDPSLIEPIAAT